MKYPKMTAEQAADLIKNGDTLSFSGFTAAGTPRVVPAALAHAEGREFMVDLFTGAVTNDGVDDALAKAHAVRRRMPFNGSSVMRNAINSGEVNYFDMHLSVVGQYVRYGFLGKVDFCIIEAVDLNDKGEIVLENRTKGSLVSLNCQFTQRQTDILKAGGLLLYTKENGDK